MTAAKKSNRFRITSHVPELKKAVARVTEEFCL